jgi:tetratricopeptide (TPR) repeat protein
MDTEQAFADALANHRAGRDVEAERGYRDVLDRQPDHADALYYFGWLTAADDPAAAAALMEKSLRLAPAWPERANNLGTLYQGLGDFERAAQWFKRAIETDAGQIEARFNLAALRQAQGRAAEAEAGYREVIRRKPEFAPAYSNLGTLLRVLERLDEARDIAAEAVRRDPGSAKARNNLGVILHERLELMAAFESFKKATELDPGFADAFNNLGSVFRDEKRFDGATACYRKAIALDPNHGSAHNNLGSIMQRQGEYDAAEACFARALGINPTFPPALSNLGTIRHRMNRQEDAVALFRRALEIDPNYADAHFNLSEVMLLTGRNLETGWREHRWRWRKREFRNQWRDFGVPVWDGSDPAGRTIAVWGEQGIGEEIMYAGMVPDLLAAGANVVLECEPRLMPLFERSFPGVTCLARTVGPTAFQGDLDFHIATGDLGMHYRRGTDEFPDRPSYLVADEQRQKALRASYANGDAPLVGLSWYSANPEIGWEKSVDLADWQALLETPGVRFVDLQYGDTRAKREAFQAATGIEIMHDETIDQLKDLDAFAAQVAAMDLIVSISNTTVHMAGALGVPCWTLLSEVPLWRWFQDRADSPWYRSLRLFRQRRAGNWGEIVGEAAAALAAWKDPP